MPELRGLQTGRQTPIIESLGSCFCYCAVNFPKYWRSHAVRFLLQARHKVEARNILICLSSCKDPLPDSVSSSTAKACSLNWRTSMKHSALSQRPKQPVVHAVSRKFPIAFCNQSTRLSLFQSPVSPSKSFSVVIFANMASTFLTSKLQATCPQSRTNLRHA